MVISRSLDTTVAFQVSNALKTDKRIIMRNNESMYDVTVIIGPDFTERDKVKKTAKNCRQGKNWSMQL